MSAQVDHSPRATRGPVVVVALAVLLSLAALVLYSMSYRVQPLGSHGESREALVVAAMVQQDNLVLPLRNGVDVPSKPPLFHWLAYAASQATGALNEVTVRIPSAVFAALTLGLFFLIVGTLLDLRAAFMGVLALGTSLEFMRNASLARVDMVFSFFCALATVIWLAVVHRWLAKRKARLLVVVAVPLMVLAALAKGPAGIALPLLVAGSAWLVHPFRRWPKMSEVAGVGFASLFALLLAGTWYLAAYRIGGQEFLNVHLMRENIGRVVPMEDFVPGHRSPFYLSPLMLLLSFVPWSVMLPWTLLVFWGEGRRDLRADAVAARFCLSWVVAYTVFFGLTSSLRAVYFLPAAPALAYLLSHAFFLSRFSSVGERTRQITAQTMIAASTLIGLLIVVVDLHYYFTDGRLPWLAFLKPHDLELLRLALRTAETRLEIIPLILAGLMLTIIGAMSLWYDRMQRAVESYALGCILCYSVLSLGLLPSLAQALSPKQFAQEHKELLSAGPVYQIPYKRDFFALSFYLQRDLPIIRSGRALSDAEALVVCADVEVERLAPTFKSFEVLAKSEELAAYGRARLVLARVRTDNIAKVSKKP